MKKNRIKLIISWIISLSLVVYLISQSDKQAMLDGFRTLDVLTVVYMVLIYLIGILVRAVRSKLMIPKLSLMEALGSVCIGYAANNILPARLGEIARAHVVGKSCGVKRSLALSSILVERILDGAVIVLLMVLAMKSIELPEWAIKVRQGGIILFSCALLGVLIAPYIGPKILSLIPNQKIKSIGEGFLEGIQLASRSLPVMVSLILLSFLVWVVEEQMFVVASDAFGLGIAPFSLFFVLGVINLGILVPSSPGYIGVYHYFCTLALGVFGVPMGKAVAYGVVLHASQVIPTTIIGLLFLPYFGLKSTKEMIQ